MAAKSAPAKDPLHTTDHDPGAAAPDPGATSDFVQDSSTVDEEMAAYERGPTTEPTGTKRVPAAVSVPGYEIEDELGRGGMGVVYKARHV